jgi:predicted nucleic acid-binding protein
LHRLFLDANVLFSAAYRPGAGLVRLWKLRDVALLTSSYALEEARRNLEEPAQRIRLSRLVRSVAVWTEPQVMELPEDVDLHPKDRPILLAAIASGATHLLTGDVRDFGRYLGKSLHGVLVVTPGAYLRRRG